MLLRRFGSFLSSFVTLPASQRLTHFTASPFEAFPLGVVAGQYGPQLV